MRNLYTTRGVIGRGKLFWVLLLYILLLVGAMLGGAYWYLERGIPVQTANNQSTTVTLPTSMLADLAPLSVVDLSGSQALPATTVSGETTLGIKPSVAARLTLTSGQGLANFPARLPIVLDTTVLVENVTLPTLTIGDKTYPSPKATLQLPLSINTEVVLNTMSAENIQFVYVKPVEIKTPTTLNTTYSGELALQANYRQQDVALEAVGVELKLAEPTVMVTPEAGGNSGILLNAQALQAKP